ncbi:SH3 domain-containing protein [Psychrobacter sp. PAMC 21119]|uniref:SH3 domain-containing protein n=1 Tax=Psychrobacter sp. PAMC 21119 TaxID=1112209 RepID=UPI000289F3A4|nr:SH3 domain-containing protein [Psychrobacter sp. PAMC 21119]
MKAFVLLITLALVSCDSTGNTNQPETKSSVGSITTPKQSASDTPLHFKNANEFRLFLDTNQYGDEEKIDMINDFFDSISDYSTSELTLSFASIGANVKWDVDLISQFKHNMQKAIINDPNLLISISESLNKDELERFAKFYFGNVIWNDEFPSELYYLKANNSQSFKVFIDTFYERYQAMSSRILNTSYIVADKDGNTNIRELPSSNSKRVGKFNNGSKVTALWIEGDWLFVHNKSNIGYVHVSNLNAADSAINRLKSDDNFNKVILEKEADLDMDGDSDFISVVKPKEQDDRNFDLEISVYRMVNKEVSLWQQNTLMFKDPLNGCMMDGLEDISTSSGKFTLEYTSCYDNKYAKRFVSFSYSPQSDDFKVTKNIISFFNSESNEMNQTFNCKDDRYFFSTYNDDCDWL